MQAVTQHRSFARESGLILLLSLLAGCGSSESQLVPVTLSWQASPEAVVNQDGGGYRVYLSRQSQVSIDNDQVRLVDVPYVSGEWAPTSLDIELYTGTWYWRVQAYSALIDPWTGQPAASAPSTESTLFVNGG